MANLKASKKDIRKTIKRSEHNHYQRARLRTLAKKIQHQAEGGEIDLARATLIEYTTYLDRAGQKHLIHPRQADRKKGRMVKYLNRVASDVVIEPQESEQKATESSTEKK